MNLTSAITPGLLTLRSAFVDRGYDIRIVGGAVRDILSGVRPKDTDLCTDANPDEQIAIYQTIGVRYFETGLHHGTVTVLVDGEALEITSLRTETDHDGRHATVSYTRDWIGDLARRDLTINAMSLTLDGQLIDPFGGREDLAARRVRFVGAPAERMREDYLRILRWLRFHARLAPDLPLDADAFAAAMLVGKGLSRISRERVWSEVSRMATTRAGISVLSSIGLLGLAQSIGLVGPLQWWNAETVAEWTGDPVATMSALLDDNAVEVSNLATTWRWSTEERQRGLFIAEHMWKSGIDGKAMIARDGVRKDWVILLLRAKGMAWEANVIEKWDTPVFPVSGDDLIKVGMKPGPALGVHLKALREQWAASNYTLDKAALMRS